MPVKKRLKKLVFWKVGDAASEDEESAPTVLPKMNAQNEAPWSQGIRSESPSTCIQSSRHCNAPARNMHERLWNEAYDTLKADEPKTVSIYERILSLELEDPETSHADDINLMESENIIAKNSEERWSQMQTLIAIGLQKRHREAMVKQGLSDGLQTVLPLKKTIELAVKSSPEASIAWVGICTGIEIILKPLKEENANREGLSYVIFRMSWYWSLVDLLLDENQTGDATLELRNILEQHICQLYQKLLLYQIRSICLYRQNWLSVLIRDTFKLIDWSTQLAEIKACEAAVQRDSEYFNTEQIKTRLQAISTTAQAKQHVLQCIHSAVHDQTFQQERQYESRLDIQCLQDLRETDPWDDKTRIESIKGGLLKDSYIWITQHDDFQQLRTNPEKHLLWIRGDPGKGKTMLMCGILDELKASSDGQVACFFCQATEPHLSNATAVLRGLLYSLVRNNPSLISHVRDRYDSAGKSLFEGNNAWEALSKILEAVIDDGTLSNVVFVVDGLDECSVDRLKLLDFITATAHSKVRWIVSSRNWVDIEERLDHADLATELRLELNEASISRAVDFYIQFKVDRLASVKKYDAKTKISIQEYLLSNADSTFLWVALVCQELGDPKVRKRHTSQKLVSFPPGLTALYARMTDQIRDSDDSEICKNILSLVSFAYRPVSLLEMKTLVSLFEDDDSIDDVRDVVASCGSFLTVRNNVVYFVHQSAKDYLLQQYTGQLIQGGERAGHHIIFTQSLQVLSKTLERDKCKIEAPGLPIGMISSEDIAPLEPIRYCAIYWISHLLQSASPDQLSQQPDLEDEGSVHRFLRDKYLYWIETIALLQGMSDATAALLRFGTVVLKNLSPKLSSLISDFQRFILYFRPAIETAPFQAYASALIFSPSNSLVRKLFHENEPRWVEKKPRMETNWSPCLRTFEAHTDSCEAIVCSGNSQILATASMDATINLWNLASGNHMHTLSGDQVAVIAIAFRNRDKELVSCSETGLVKAWSTTTGRCIETWDEFDRTNKPGHHYNSSATIFSSNGDSLLLTGDSGHPIVVFWDIQSNKKVYLSWDTYGYIISTALANKKSWLLTGHSDGTICFWDIADTVKCRYTLPGHHGESLRTKRYKTPCSPRGHLDQVETNPSYTSADAGKQFKSSKSPNGTVYSLLFLHNDERFVSRSGDDCMRIWDSESGTCLFHIPDNVESCPMGHRLVLCSDTNRFASYGHFTVQIWNGDTATRVQTLPSHPDFIHSAAFAGNSHTLAMGFLNGSVKLYDIVQGAQRDTHTGKDSHSLVRVLSDDGMKNIFLYEDRHVSVLDTGSGDLVSDTKFSCGHANYRAILSHDRKYLICYNSAVLGSYRDITSLFVRNLSTGTCIHLNRHFEGYTVDNIVPSRSHQLAFFNAGKIVIYNISSGACCNTLKQSAHVSVLSNDGDLFAFVLKDGQIVIWNTKLNKHVILPGNCPPSIPWDGTGGFQQIFFSADNSLLGVYIDEHIHIWDTASHALLRILKIRCRYPICRVLGFSNHGRWVVSTSFWAHDTENEVVIQDTASGECLHALEVFGAIDWTEGSFEHITDTLFKTRFGIIDFDKGPAQALQPGGAPFQSWCYRGYGLSADGAWILKDGNRMLWLPPEYRFEHLVVNEGMVTLGWDGLGPVVMKLR